MGRVGDQSPGPHLPDHARRGEASRHRGLSLRAHAGGYHAGSRRRRGDMRWFDRVLRRRQLYDDLSSEIRSHLEEKTDALIARGLSPAEARAEARRAFGNVTSI